MNALLAYALLLLFAYTVAWIGSWVGLYMPNPETANTAGLIWLFPLTFLSNCFVPINTLPGPLQTFAAWNPISAVVLSCRELFGNPTGIQPDYWPLNNPVLYSLLSCSILIIVFGGLAVRRYQRATSR
jgi:ABC-2 type transport system permease protein